MMYKKYIKDDKNSISLVITGAIKHSDLIIVCRLYTLWGLGFKKKANMIAFVSFWRFFFFCLSLSNYIFLSGIPYAFNKTNLLFIKIIIIIIIIK
jgi:hypothetical protein